MRKRVRLVWIAVTCLVIVPAAAHAQASITGTVKDSSGAVLPGVTVEATSPALIEKVRAVVTDGTGQYRIVDLRPGTYSVTFSLTGFATVKRERIELTGSFTASVNAELRVGSLEETITVTGESPIVDVQSAKRQQVVSGDVLASLPATRAMNAVLVLMAGITGSVSSDVALTPGMSQFGIHGGPSQEGRVQVDGLNIGASRGGAGTGGYVPDIGNSEEVTFSSSGGLGEAEVGGPYMNIVPRTGGNMIKGSFFAAGTSSALQSSNYTNALQDAGLRAPAELLKLWDINGAVGGPIRKDRIWYFFNMRDVGSGRSVPGMYANKNAGDPTKWTYEPDLSRQARNDSSRTTASLRLTWQVTSRNKVNLFWDEQPACSGSSWTPDVEACRKPKDGWIQGGSATSSPETATYSDKPQRVQQATWTSPVTNRLLMEAGFGTYLVAYGGQQVPGNLTLDLVQVTEQAGSIPNLVYRSQNWADNWIGAHTWRAAVSYITGAHNMKFGYNGAYHVDDEFPFTNNQRLTYRFSNGVPNQLTMSRGPAHTRGRVKYAALYAQEQWTHSRVTLQGAVRYDHAWSYFPAQQVGPDRFIPVPIVFPDATGVTYHDITPRIGVAYDLFGTRKTSLKVNLGKYLDPASGNVGNYSATNPIFRVPTTTNRSWTDANRNFVPDCDLLNPAVQDLRASGGDACGAFSNANFGREVFSIVYDPAILEGWGIRPWDWQVGAAIQHEVLPRVSVEASYNRRWWGNFTVSDNRAVGPSDFSAFSITAPLDPRLPDGGGYVISDLFDISSSKFGQTADFRTDASNFGNQTRYWHGVDVSVSARLRGGLTVQGGTSTGRLVVDYCEIRAKLPGQPALASTGSIPLSPTNPYCHDAEPFLTQVKGLATYTIPKVDVLVSGTFRGVPGPQLAANWNVPSAVVQQTLGRPLAGGAANVLVNLLKPGQRYGDRINDLDIRLAKILRFGRTRTQIGVDLYNALNSDVALGYNQTYSPTSTTWLTPTSVLSARLARFSAQIDF